ncbi:MAG: T9SS type A sorting domain-containing protein, partial [Mangrovimonas sp.]|nr:T9SS type A sorting domain-containing protein [Mangrovimonas sp.]
VTPVVGGTIEFNNGQRIFKKEAVSGTNTGSVFFRTNESTSVESSLNAQADNRMKIRLKFDSPKGYHRVIMAGVDPNASDSYDLAYDAPLNEDQNEDFFWRFDSQNYIINAVDNFNPDQVLPLGLKTTLAGNVVISIQELENIPDNIDIFIHDIQLDTYHNLKESNFVINLPQGNYMNRFEVTFNDNALGIEDVNNTTLEVSYLNSNESIAITNPNGLSFTSVEMFNVLGQSIYKITKNLSSESYQELKAPLASGSYIIKLKTSEGAVLSKKVLVD